ncbi:MAG: AraC family transcriptional regulator [Saccharopolyspora rectivirgula]
MAGPRGVARKHRDLASPGGRVREDGVGRDDADGEEAAAAADAAAAPPLLVLTADVDRHAFADLHQHSEHLLMWASTATVRVRAADRDWLVPPTHALWVPAGCPHAGDVLRPGRGYGVMLDTERSAISWREPTGVVMTPLLRELVRHLAGKPAADLFGIAHVPGDGAGGRPAPSSAPGRCAAESLLLALLEPAPSTSFHVPVPDDPRVRAIAEALLANPADPSDLDGWARRAHVGVRTITRLFAAETGMTFAQWRTHVRVRAALTQLARGGSVESAARAVGYRKPAAFSEVFRRVTGQHPAVYVGAGIRGQEP